MDLRSLTKNHVKRQGGSISAKSQQDFRLGAARLPRAEAELYGFEYHMSPTIKSMVIAARSMATKRSIVSAPIHAIARCRRRPYTIPKLEHWPWAAARHGSVCREIGVAKDIRLQFDLF